MVKVFEGTPNEYYMDGFLKNNLDIIKEKLKQDWDAISLYDGREGSGKSIKALQDAYFCDPTFNLSRICFTPHQFRKAILEAKPYQSVVYDEAYTGLSSRSAMSLINRALVAMIAEIRQKNLFVFIVMPCYFDLDKYFALWRSTYLIHVYVDQNMRRGFFAFYNYDRKKNMYIRGKKTYDYNCVKANFIGRFTNHYVVDEKDYRKLKKESLHKREEQREKKAEEQRIEGMLLERVLNLPNTIPHRVKMEVLNMHPSTYFVKLRQHKEMDSFTENEA